jgi:hypothetical protein
MLFLIVNRDFLIVSYIQTKKDPQLSLKLNC